MSAVAELSTPELISLAQNGDNTALETLLNDNSGLIWSVVRRYFGHGVEADDLFQLGSVGFLKAVKGFDTSFGTQFSTYAVPKIAGEIRRFLRDDGSVKVSRSLKEKAQLIRVTREKLTKMLGREPVLSELSKECGLEAEEIAEAEIATTPTESLSRETNEDGCTLEGILGDDGMEDSLLESISLREAVDELPERERSVVLLRYYKNMTQESTARVLSVSQVQISRLERKAMEMLRKMLQN